MKSEKSFRVGRGSYSVTVYPVNHSSGSIQWRFNKLGGEKGKVTRSKRSKAKDAAERYLLTLSDGRKSLDDLPEEKIEVLEKIMATLPEVADLAEFLAWREQRAKSPAFSSIVESYLADKIARKGHESRHLGRVGRTLRDLVTFCGGDCKMGEISFEKLTSWRESRRGATGPANANFLRVAASGLWKWAGKHGHITMEESRTVERMPVIPIERGEIRYCSNDEALLVLREIRVEFRAFAVLGLFAGLRPEEISPQKGTRKPGLDWGAVSDEDDCIYLPADVSKVNEARLIPLTDCLRSWLAWAGWFPGRLGPVCPFNKRRQEEPGRLGKLLDKEFQRNEGWPHDWLRHSYGTYRNALLRSLHQVAEEMGTSVNMMKRHYHQPKPKHLGESFFSLRPGDLEQGRVVEMKKSV